MSLAQTAAFADPQIEALGQTFLANLPSDWHSVRGDWNYFDVVGCFIAGDYCYGNNPSSPYGYPGFGNAAPISPFQLGQSEAVVIFFRTPPQMRYFAMTQYLMTRGGNAYYIFASLSDSLNLLRLSTLQSVAPVENVFNQDAVVVWTADQNTFRSVRSLLGQQGIPASNVNYLPMPYTLPLYMNYGDKADTYGMVMRTALPEVQADLDSYMNEKPFFVVKVGPDSPPPISPAPKVGFASEVSGVTEAASLATALDELVSDIKTHYAESFSFKDQAVKYSDTVGWDCIETLTPCSSDNHDDLIAMDVTRAVTVKSLSDVVIVAGVNHHATGKALYMNHSINDTVQSTGIFSIDDPQLTTQSALYHAGVRSASDPRVKRYRNLYAYAISYDCGSLKFCQQIPTPTSQNPIGLQPGAPFLMWGRSYLNAQTRVRPDADEIVRHQVLLGTRK
ncbi:MAG: hypothetical protein JSR59_19370 [Proteobacteria bacterium]|nr:hypothetical protein [Pseudomonadota bacterium]